MAPPAPAKRSKAPSRKSERLLTVDEVKVLGRELLDSRAHINNLPRLLPCLSPSSPLEIAVEALLSIQSFFVPLLAEIPPASTVPGAADADPEAAFRSWLRERFEEYVSKLIEIATANPVQEELLDVVLDALMEVTKIGKDRKFHSAIYYKFLRRLVYATDCGDEIFDLLKSNYFKFTDVRYFTLTSLSKIAKGFDSAKLNTEYGNINLDYRESESRVELPIYHLYKILSSIPTPDLKEQEKYDTWSVFSPPSKSKEKIATVSSNANLAKKLKLKFTKAWLSFLKLPLPLDVYKEVLSTLHQSLIPSMANPVMLCDFLTKSYDIGGVISVMALSSLFILMTKHGLEYPKFYEKLYALLTPAVFLAKHRAAFFELLDICLKSSYLPAYLAAAFAKKLSRLLLSVPPSGALIIIALIHNLLHRHPSIKFLTDSVSEEKDTPNSSDIASESNSRKSGIDPFIIEERDPEKCNAMRSSLWEIDTLRHHYFPAVSRFMASLENDLTVRASTTEMRVADFSSGSYATVFGNEIRRRVKQVPLAFYGRIPTSLFDESDFPGWTFDDTNGENCLDDANKKRRVEA